MKSAFVVDVRAEAKLPGSGESPPATGGVSVSSAVKRAVGGAMRVEEIDEAVSVRADFRGGEVTPRAFRRGQRSYNVTEVNARWVDREGAHPVWRFSVQAEGDTYVLALRTGEMTWRLEKVMVEG